MHSTLSHMMMGLLGTEVPPYLVDLAKRGLRSVCIYGENVDSEAQLKEYVTEIRSQLGKDCIIAIDEEGGEVTRVDYRSGSRFAGNGFLGRLDNPDLTARDGRLIAQLLGRLGINLNLAPVADVNLEPENPVIGIRSFGSDQERVAQHVASFVAAHEQAGIGTTLKHFPGHGNTRSDSHHELPFVEGGLGELIATQMLPFEKGIEAGASAVMLAHLDLGLSTPSSLAPEVVKLLREVLGFEGIIVTDALDMGALGGRAKLPENAIQALLAGVDLVCLGPRTTLAELDRIEELGQEMHLSNTDRLVESNMRLSRFEQRKFADPLGPERPQYQLDDLAPAAKKVRRVVRFAGDSNPAVGMVPWYSGLGDETQIATAEGLRQMVASSSEPVAVLFRTAQQASSVLTELEGDGLNSILAVMPEPPAVELGIEFVVTYGSALPQTAVLSRFLSEGHVNDVN